jgi:hypothetical protein
VLCLELLVAWALLLLLLELLVLPVRQLLPVLCLPD